MAVKISKDDAVAVCTALGWATSAKWDKKRMLRKLKEVVELAEENEELIGEDVVEDDDERERLNKLVKRMVKAKGDVDVTLTTVEEPDEEEETVEDTETETEDADEEEEEEEEDEPAPKKKSAKTKKAPAKDEDEDEEEEEKPKKAKAKAKKAPAKEEDEEDDTVPAKPKKEKKAKVKNGEVDKFGSRLGSQAATINAALSKKAKSFEAIAKETDLTIARVKGHTKFLAEKGVVTITDDGVSLV